MPISFAEEFFNKYYMSDLLRIMQEPLPTIGAQKRYCFRTTTEEVTGMYDIINRLVFDNVLTRPEIIVKGHCRNFWGMCYGEVYDDDWNKPFCRIQLMNRWYAKQWMVVVLAHEMCHQYTWVNMAEERLAAKKKLLMSHGPSFFLFRDRLAEHGIPLNREYSRKKWFLNQSFIIPRKRLNTTLCEI